ncbi:Protein kinase domain containing protein [Reticulomyxa filosa]|uniref:Protein kinase domain containing protein n=1 Tax=Reticulomyxa filosa TaxID=46433 RepID=X6PCZ4_RETFI|nr:Protein kinase domain containing protein [Reticulomyxa filosa]|eukprot:ETO35547.1 Protein kinase domain containing protein [Reticulomyxa filosa]
MLVLNPQQRITAVQGLEHPWLSDLHREEDEITCPKFDLSFEFEKSIKTKFGVRHMMYDALLGYQQDQLSKPQHRYKFVIQKKTEKDVDDTSPAIKEENEDDDDDNENEDTHKNEKRKKNVEKNDEEDKVRQTRNNKVLIMSKMISFFLHVFDLSHCVNL